jgi:phosphonate transport system substrate-binding protein
MKTQLRLLKIFLLRFLLLAGSTVRAKTVNYSFDIVPQQSTKKLALLWRPILKQISDETSLKVNFKTAPNIPTFEKLLAAGEYEFAYTNHYIFTFFHQTNDYPVLAKIRNKLVKGILAVRKDSAIKQIVDLDASTQAFPAPAAFDTSILNQSKLNVSSIKFKPKYVSAHNWFYRTVAKGLYPAGGNVIRTFSNVTSEICDQLRELLTSRSYTINSISVHLWVRKKALVRSSIL